MLSWLRSQRLTLTPTQQVQAIADRGRRLLLLDGADPSFSTDWRPGPGWWLIDVVMDFDGDAVDATMYFDWGTGYCDAGAVRWPLTAGARGGKRLVFFADSPIQVRFDPSERRLIARTLEVRVRRVTAAWAESRIHRRINQALQRGLVVATELERPAGDSTPRSLDDWYEIYDRMFRRGADPYSQWIAGRERHLSEHLLRQPERSAEIDLLVPVWNTDPVQFEAMLTSVRAQSHTRWRLLLVDDGSTRAETLAALAAAPARDPRIVVHRREQNGGITAASQTALGLAQADWVALLDHDDVLHPHALRWIAETIHLRPDARVIYTDEDKVATGQGRSEPFFKPDFNPDLLLAQNYLCHLLAFNRQTGLACGGFRQGYEGAQDHDLVLRLTDAAGAKAVVHLPVIAYHWRMSATSTASAAEAKPYARAATVHAVADFLSTRAPGAVVEEGRFPNTTRIRWPLPDPAPLVSLIVPTRDGGEVLARCVKGILEQTDYSALELLLVDNQSKDPYTLEVLERAAGDPRVRVLAHNAPFNYSAINNRAAAQAKGALFALVNDDIEVTDSTWLREMVSLAVRSDIGCVGAKLLYPDGTLQHAGVVTGLGGVAGHSHKYAPADTPGYFRRLAMVHDVSAVTAACLVVRRSVFEQVKGLDEVNLAVAFNDVDFCLRVREAGYRNLWTPWAELIHHESKSRGADTQGGRLRRFQRELAYMQRRWEGILDRDPFYSPNLTLGSEDFAVRKPEERMTWSGPDCTITEDHS